MEFENKIDNVISWSGELIAENLNLSEDTVKKYFEGEKFQRRLQKLMKLYNSESFPIIRDFIHIYIYIFSSLYATLATSERNFSSLRRLKTLMRSRILEERLKGLPLFHCYNIDYDDVTDEIA